MNKTVKTIAWICLVLGLMGSLADVAMLYVARNKIDQISASMQNSDLHGRFVDLTEEEIEVIKEKRADLFDSDTGEFGFSGGRGRAGGLSKFDKVDLGSPMKWNSRFTRRASGFPVFLVICGPVLTVIGAVTLIVNREPKAIKEKVNAKNKTKEK